MNVKPISPDEVVQKKKTSFPDFVLEAFNELITKNFRGKSAIIKQNDVVNLIVSKGAIDIDAVFAAHYLDVEDVYRDAGWKVSYDKPAYCEDYEPTFTFSK